ncbi:MAG: cell surface protein SprA [Ignavibacteriaceae bacterium]|nr:cell surface protein SprA [Ignavibacteriaceae bacterium]
MSFLLPSNSPNEMELDFEIPDSDSGETKLEGGEEIVLDPTFNFKDSTEALGDSTDALSDSLLAKEDTVKIDWRTLDSTARLEQFRFQRDEKSYVEAGEKKQSKFFAQPTTSYKQRTVKIDSTGQFVEVREKVGAHEPKLLLRMPIEDYVELKLALKEREEWEKQGYTYELKSGTIGLGELITSFTDFEIPLPSVGVLSIFGEPKISLKIGGSVQIHGAWRSETTEGVTANRLGNTRNEPDFKQQVQINVSGTIGDKLNINADWNTERTFEYENQLKIKYTGYDDEIIQSIEAGNVSMQTPSLIGGAEALFGVKALFKMGPFKLTALASQKKGETKEVAVSGGSTSQEYSVRAYDYSENHYFIDEIYADRTLNLFENFYSNIPSQYDPQYKVNEIEVWKSINQVVADQSKIRYANCFIDLPPISPGSSYPDSLKEALENPRAGKEETGRFLLLQEGTDYTLHSETGYISFKTSLNEQDIIGVAFKQGPNNFTYGQFLNTVTQNDTLIVLKLVKPKNLQPTYDEAWSLRLKNIYPTGARNVKPEGFEFKIRYEVVGQEPTEELPGGIRLIQAFGFDQQGSGGSPTPDNIFDWRVGYTILPETGEIIFPTLEPFGRDIPAGLEELVYQSIYDTTKTYARQDKAPDKWVFTGKNTGTSSATYQLGFNVVENSVKVRLNGRELREGTDYTVDYNIGQLTIRNEAALVPGADLKISYEQNDLFQLASKTLLGARGVYDFSDKTTLGFTIMNLNQETLSDKVRIGEEPLSNTIYGVDFRTSADLPFLTNTLDYLISTREMSSFTFNGEYAYMSPDPNTKKSTIAEDGGESIAYIDDFEGAKRLIPVGVNYTGWKDLSVPERLNVIGDLNRQQRMSFKSKSFWYTVTPSDVVVDSIYGGRKQVARSDQQITVLDYVFVPDTPGTYNTDPDLVQKENNWGGMMRLLSSTANNLVEQNIEFVEFWMKIERAPVGATLNLDLGVISEDVIPNNQLNTEDKNLNDAIDEGEDTGLDGFFDAQERVEYQSTKSDPAGDNFLFTGNPLSIFDYFNINGTEGNAVLTDVGLLPDTEDLNRNGSVDLANNYYRYTIPLTTDTASNPFIAGGGFTSSNWFLYRIPLKDTSAIIGSPSFSNVETIRLYIQGVDSVVHVRITEFNLVGNQWQKLIVEDSVLSVSVVSLEENDRYTSPPGVFRERDRTRPDEEIYNNEQSLSLVYNDLPDGESREAVKYLFRPLDVFSYTEMKLFVHGELDKSEGTLSFNDPLTGQYSSEAFFRFGTDTANYYEYRQPVDSGWNSISIKFSDLTAIKVAAAVADSKIPVPGLPGHFYVLKGKPTLTSIKFLSVGVFNLDDPTFNSGPLSGEVWINELRVVGADDTPGMAFTFNTSLKFADLMTVNFNMSQTDPYFHRLSERFGSRVENQNWAVSTDLDILKLVPFNMRESNLKVSYSHTESLGKPLYIPGTDVKVDEAAKQFENSEPDSLGNIKTPEDLYTETQTLTVTNTISSSNIKLKLPTDVWYVRDTWNALSFGFNYNNRFNRSPTVLEANSWLWNASTNYAFNFSPDLHIKLSDLPIVGIVFSLFKDYKDLKIYFAPQNFSANVTANRNRNSSQTRPRPNVPTDAIVSQDFTTGRGFSFNWKLTEGGLINLSVNYNVNMNSSLADILTDSLGNERPEGEIWDDIVGGAGFGKDYRYQQSFDVRTTPKLPSLWDINRYFTLNAGYSVGYRWDFDLRQEDIGRSAGNNQKFTTGVILRWKSLTEPLFGKEEPTTNKGEIEKGKDVEDSTNIIISDKPSSLNRAFQFLVSTIKYVFFDWENFTTNYTHDYSVSKSGIRGTGTGFYNFWGITQDDSNGPSRAFQLGLSSDVGPRAFSPNSNTNLSDLYSEKNSIDFKTARPLWEGAKIDINWNVNWSENKNVSLNADQFGNITITNTTATGSLTRSFLSLPPSLPLVESGIQKVFALYNPNAQDPRKSLSDAFVEGFETLPLLSGLPMFSDVNEYIPRANWRITWDGLEKILFFKSLAERISLDHAYSSSYTEGWKLTSEGNQEIQTQRIEYGFTPFAGLNITFGQIWGGNMNGSIKFSSRTTYDLGASTSNINETSSQDIGFTASFSKAGFDVPLFGVSLKNDVEFLISYTSTKNSVVRYEMNNFTEEGIPQDGTTRTTIEPRIKYTISSKVSLSIFYKRSTVEPEGAARIPPTTTNEAGLDVNIVIQ